MMELEGQIVIELEGQAVTNGSGGGQAVDRWNWKARQWIDGIGEPGSGLMELKSQAVD